jgi:hypothetical protein
MEYSKGKRTLEPARMVRYCFYDLIADHEVSEKSYTTQQLADLIVTHPRLIKNKEVLQYLSRIAAMSLVHTINKGLHPEKITEAFELTKIQTWNQKENKSYNARERDERTIIDQLRMLDVTSIVTKDSRIVRIVKATSSELLEAIELRRKQRDTLSEEIRLITQLAQLMIWRKR